MKTLQEKAYNLYNAKLLNYLNSFVNLYHKINYLRDDEAQKIIFNKVLNSKKYYKIEFNETNPYAIGFEKSWKKITKEKLKELIKQDDLKQENGFDIDYFNYPQLWENDYCIKFSTSLGFISFVFETLPGSSKVFDRKMF